MSFLKYYDVDQKRTFFCGHLMINCKAAIRSYIPQILERAHLSPGTPLNFFEVSHCNSL